MAERPPLRLVLEVEYGHADPRALVFEEGSRGKLISVGARGEWMVTAGGVSDVEFFLRFDGQSLFVKPARPQAVAIQGTWLGADWVRLIAACQLQFGDARIRFYATSDAAASLPPVPIPTAPLLRPPLQPSLSDRATIADIPPDTVEEPTEVRAQIQPPSSRRPPLPSLAPPSSGESTQRFEYAELQQAAVELGIPFRRPPEGDVHEASPPPQADAARPTPQAAPSEPIVAKPPKVETVEAPSRARIVILSCLVAMVGVSAGLMVLKDAGILDGSRWGRGGGSTSAEMDAAVEAGQPATAEGIVVHTGETSDAGTTADDDGGDEADEDGGLAFEPAPFDAGRPKDAATDGLDDALAKLERAAVDAARAGAFEEAANLYEKLARLRPDNPAYREAARIMRSRSEH